MRSEKEVALEWVGLMRKELEKLKDRLRWLDDGLVYLETFIQKEVQKK